jgi:2,3-dihydroxybenzoate decarboxylase
MGVDRMMFSADYPFEKMEDAATWFDKTPLTDAQRLQIGRTNAIKLFKLNLM